MTMRALAFVVAAIALAGCVQDNGTLDPVTDANWKQRDKDLMSNLPYNQSRLGRPTVGISSIISARKRPALFSSIATTSFSITSCRRARRSATE